MSGLRKNIERWMRQDEIGTLPGLFLSSLSSVYSSGVRLRSFLYGSGIYRAKRLPCRVISVGNLTVGGTGKTPVAIHIAEFLKKNNARVAILSRGYKGSTKGVTAVSDGKNILTGPKEAGDEPYLMAERLKGVPVVIGADRYKAGLFAIENFSPDFIILDDGFQHIRLARDLNILLIDSIEGFGNGHLLPRGILREPVEAVKRADMIMVKGGASKDDLKRFDKPVFEFSYKPIALRDINNNIEAGLGFITGRKVLAIAGIASPSSFFKSLAELNADIIKTLSFPDHHDYIQSDINEIRARSRGAELIIATEKDGVKLKGQSLGLPAFSLAIDAEIKDKETFYGLLLPRK
ncbi:MAG: tetraacyldisaccharide 4'-kinase, partial [Deltaproteobacteria bacterium]|nr:tetraacyldisaccharide 4'-kinase [Deltaproteobacteria bacterium]